jgi:hypothetical protein
VTADGRERLPLYDATAPIACTIGADEVQERIELFERLRIEHVRIDRTEHGVLLHFPARPDIEADLRRFAVAEKRCCGFWGFDIERVGTELTLRWEAPPAAGEVVERLVIYLRGDEPLTALTGLL